jgi:hypothetical protein
MKFLSSLAGSVNSVADSVKAKQSSLKTSMTRSAPGSSVPIPEAGGGAAEAPQDGTGRTPSILQRPLRLGSFDFDGGPTFPDLYHEASTMLHLSNLIYVLAEIREMARTGALGDSTISSRVLDLPLRLDDAAKILLSEAPLLREKYDDGAHAGLMGAIGSLLGRHEAVAREAALAATADAGKEDAGTAGAFGWIANWCGGPASADGGGGGGDVGDSKTEPGGASMITAVGDSRSNEELVYAVGVNHLEGRISVIFRGSATRADFLADSRISLVRAPGPRSFHGAGGGGQRRRRRGSPGIPRVPDGRAEGRQAEQVRGNNGDRGAIARGGARAREREEGGIQAVRHGSQPGGCARDALRILRVGVPRD